MHFPHNRNGFSGLGRQHANELETIDVPFLRHNLPGARALKKGDGFTYVEVQQTAQQTLWVDARSGSDWVPEKISTAGGAFDVAAYPSVTVPQGDESTSSVQNFGGNAGYSLLRREDSPPGNYTDTWLGLRTKYRLALRSAGADADADIPEINVISASVGANDVGNAGVAYKPAALGVVRKSIVPNGNNYRSQHEFAMLGADYDLGFLFHQYARVWKGGSDVQRIGVPDGRYPLRPLVVRLSPDVRVMMRRYLFGARIAKTAGAQLDTASPIVFSVSRDAGATWSDLSLPAVDTLTAGIVSVGAPRVHDGTVQPATTKALVGMTMQGAMLSGDKAFLAVTALLYDPNNQWASFVVDEVLLSLVLDLPSCSVTSTVLLFDGRTDSGYTVNGHTLSADGVTSDTLHQVIPIKGGALLMMLLPPLTPDGQVNTRAARSVVFTADGITFQQTAFMPHPACWTGRITGINQNTLVCPMYDGTAYRLFRSTDRGVTWESVGTLSGKYPAPDPALIELQSFNAAVLTTGADGQPASYSPQAPWATDPRVEAPAS